MELNREKSECEKKAVSCIKRCADKIFVFGGEVRRGGKIKLSRKLLNFDSNLVF